MATQIVASLNSKAILDSVPIGFLLLAELVSPSSSARPDGKNSKTCNIYRTNNSPPHHHKQIHHDKNLPFTHTHLTSSFTTTTLTTGLLPFSQDNTTDITS